MSFGDFYTAFSRLGQGYDQGVRDYERRNAIQALGVNPGEPQFLPKLGQALIGLGDVDGALAVSRLASADSDRAYQRTRDASNDAFRERAFNTGREDTLYNRGREANQDKLTNFYRDRSDQRADQTLKLQTDAASRREYPAGFEADPFVPGAMRPVQGGPSDPSYIGARKQAESDAKGGQSVNPYASGDAKFNGDQAKAAGFSDRMFPSEKVIQQFETINNGTFPLDPRPTLAPYLPNMALSSERQQYEQGKRDFINSQLRRESGAAISEGEFASATKQYFPQPGDSAEVIAQKRANRRAAIEAMAREGGPSYVPKFTFGEGGAVQPYTPPERQTPNANRAPSQAATVNSFADVPEGKRFRLNGKTYRKVNGQAVPE